MSTPFAVTPCKSMTAAGRESSHARETEINIMNSQCLDRRLDSQLLIAKEVAAWEKKRNIAKARIHWTFNLAAARRKLRKVYPSIEV